MSTNTNDTRTAAELEHDMIEGREEIDGDRLHKATLRERMAGLREKRDEQKAAREAEEARQVAIAELKAEILACSRGCIASRAEAIADAVKELRDECDAHNLRLHSWRSRARGLGMLDKWEAGGIALNTGGYEVNRVYVDSIVKEVATGRREGLAHLRRNHD